MEKKFTQKKYAIFLWWGVAQLVARVIWDHEVAGSNPVAPTNKVDTSHK